MNLEELSRNYYDVQRKNCAEAIFLAANDYYGLELPENSARLLSGFGGGMGCGRLCGCLAASIGVLGQLYGAREDFRLLCEQFVSAFEEKLSCGSTECSVLTAKYKNEQTRCLSTVLLAAQVLEQFVAAQPAP